MIDISHPIESTIEQIEKLKIIRNMFTDEELETLADFLNTFTPNVNNDISLSEKCYLLTIQAVNSKYCKTDGTRAYLFESIRKFSFEELLSILIVNSDGTVDGCDNPTKINYIADEVKKHDKIFSSYLLTNNITEENFDRLISRLTSNESPSASISIMKEYENEILNLIAEYVLLQQNNRKQNYDEQEQLMMLDTIIQTKRNLPNLWSKAESVSNGRRDLVKISIEFGADPDKDDYVILSILYSYIYTYSCVYDNDWQDCIFAEFFDLMNDPQKFGFILFLNLSVEEGGSPYVEDFCDAMEHYCQENNIEPAIKLDLVKRRNKHLIPDNTKYDTPQFVRVLNSKLKGVASKNPDAIDRLLYNNLNKLYDKLIEKSYIAKDTGKDLFIYRLSGLNRPDGKELGKIVMEKGMATKMGYILRCLCSDDKKDFKSSILNNFFLSNSRKKPEFSTAKYQSGEDLKKNRSLVDKNFSEAVDLLVNIGFVNCETIHKGRTKA